MTDIITVNNTDSSLILNEVKKSYRKEAQKFLDLAEARGGITIQVMEELVQNLKDEKKSGATINKHISAMKAVVREAYSVEDLPPAQQNFFEKKMKEKVPTVKLASGEKEVSEDETLLEGEYKMLIEKASDRLALIMEFLWITGARINEALSASFAMCNTSGESVKVKVIGKGNKERTVRISHDLYERINSQFRGSIYLFESSRTTGAMLDDRNIAKQIRTLGRKHLKRDIGPHMFRHSWATRMIKAGMDIKAVSKYLGHASTSITLDMYVHTKLSDADLGII